MARSNGLLFLLASILLCLAIAWYGAVGAVRWLETSTTETIGRSLEAGGHDWAAIRADGLEVHLSGTAPSESARFRALEVAARLVDTSRISDEIDVRSAATEDVPDFTLEILRNGNELSLIGLLPGAKSRITVLKSLQTLTLGSEFTDLVEAVEFSSPEGWDDSLDYVLAAANEFAQSRILLVPGRATIEAFLGKDGDIAEIGARLRGEAPEGLDLTLRLKAPKPVMAPFRFSAGIDNARLSIETCAASSEESVILVETAIGDADGERCVLALGAPSPRWPDAIIASLDALRALEHGAVRITDADVVLEGTDATDLTVFAKASRDLRAQLPELFSLKVVEPPQPAIAASPAKRPTDFRAELTADGTLRLAGAVRDTMAVEAVRNYAAARFGSQAIEASLSSDGQIPEGWTRRIFAILDAMTLLEQGIATVTLTRIGLTGMTHEEQFERELAQIRETRLPGVEASFDVTYEPKPEDAIEAPSAKECERQLAGVMSAGQIIFAPNSANISEESEAILDEIAFIITSCPDARFEIGGHTDSQGRESMNLALSQSRADSVLDSLLAREVMLSALVAKGYGETQPIADNETDLGRAANRRIEFRLLRLDDTTQDSGDETVGDDAVANASEDAESPGEEESADEQN